jgi:MoxR-like ATPase
MSDATPASPPSTPPADSHLQEALEEARTDISRMLAGLDQVLLGQQRLTRRALTGMLAGGHLLLEGLPGLGKTELVKGLARLCASEYRRIQFTPDLLPGDITGNFILEERDGRREFVFRRGPVFANILLADEVNRASPKTQSALLEAMQEGQVTVLGEAHALPRPFFVLATQNPIDLEGTYPLPEAQLDRFMMKLHVDRPEPGVMARIVRERDRGRPPELEPVITNDRLRELLALAGRVHIAEPVADFIARLVDATHPASPAAPEAVRKYVRFGASPRAAIALAAAGRARAVIDGAVHVGFDSMRDLFFDILNHRVLLDYTARIDGVTIADVLKSVLDAVGEVARPLPRGVAV